MFHVITTWLEMFCKSTEGTANECLSLDTTFYTRLLEGGRNKDNCMEVLGKIDFLKTRLIFVPIHWNHPDFKHWSVVVIKIPTFDITFIDSLDLHETIPLR
ncbi:hypothetical protein PENTCL1PPCAC_10865, partial [Pristionchus entomophagus]